MIKESLYTVRRDVICLKCRNKGAVRFYGVHYPLGAKEEADKYPALEEKRHKPFFSLINDVEPPIVPYECLGCGVVGLIDSTNICGFKLAFKQIKSNR